MRLRSAEDLLEIFDERVKPDVFLRERAHVVHVQFAPSLSASHLNPVRGLIARPQEAVRFDKGF